jgi:hypothetical protein
LAIEEQLKNNRMRNKKLFILAVLLILPLSIVLSQEEEEYDSLLRKEIIVENPVYKPVIGFGAGIMNFYGDVRNAFINPMVGNYAFKLNVSTFIDKKNNFLGNFFLYTGALTGNEQSFENPERNLNFRSEIISFGINGEYNFGHLFKKETSIIKPFISAGVEVISFNSKGDLMDSEGRPYYYWSDGTIRDIDEINKDNTANTILYRDWDFETDLREQNLYNLGNYNRTTLAFPVDIGLDFQVNPRVKMRLATSVHFTLTDLIDNVSWQGEGIVGNERNDHFTFTYLTMHLDLFSEPKVKVEELMFAELNDYDYTMFEDEDADGIIDATDDCPGTPNGVDVDTLGCPYDDDGDGVPNYIDKESGSAPGSFVDDRGVTMTEDEVIASLDFSEAVARKDINLYYTMLEEERRMSFAELPEKFHSLDTNSDAYLNFDELLKAIDDFFDYRSILVTDEVYSMINFFFAQ